MTEFWLVSAPAEPTCRETWEKLNQTTQEMSSNYKFELPDFKVGTLDQLVGLTDDLVKLDAYQEGVARKVAGYLGEVLEDRRDKLSENLRVNNMDIRQYVTHFQWDYAKFPIRQTLRDITTTISRQVSQIETDIKSKSQAYNAVKGNLQNLERKATGSLLTKNLGDIVKKEHFILGSEYLTTLLVVVPKMLYKDWQQKYEQLTDMIVPRSSLLINEDEEFGLYSVTLFQKVANEFKHKARENKFIVRDFVYDEAELAAGRNELTKLANDKKRQEAPLIRWLQVNFGEAFMAWIHVKALRVFIESVLRYGLPVNFQAMILQPKTKNTKRLRHTLNQLYAHLDAGGGGGANNNATGATGDSENFDMAGLSGFGIQSDYYPYVFFPLNIDFVDSSGKMHHRDAA